jgi:hypothetical protein
VSLALPALVPVPAVVEVEEVEKSDLQMKYKWKGCEGVRLECMYARIIVHCFV